jgi:hypothetical protein
VQGGLYTPFSGIIPSNILLEVILKMGGGVFYGGCAAAKHPTHPIFEIASRKESVLIRYIRVP